MLSGLLVWEENYGSCKGCPACLKLGHCVIDDDAVEIAARMHGADVLVFATPVYYYSVSGAGDIAGHPALEAACQTEKEHLK